MATNGSTKMISPATIPPTLNWYGAPKLSVGSGSGPTVGRSTTGGAPDVSGVKSKKDDDRRRINALLLLLKSA